MNATRARSSRTQAILLLAASCACAGYAPAAQALRLNGQLSFSQSDGSHGEVAFNCEGENPCRGLFVLRERQSACTNDTGHIGAATVTGLSLASPGPISGVLTLGASSGVTQRNPDGSCHTVPGSDGPFTTTFTGGWDGSRATLSVAPVPDGDGGTVNLAGTLAVVSSLVRISGSIAGSGTVPGSGNGSVQVSFTCEGENPCTGSASGVLLDPGCSNSFSLSGAFGLLGLDLSQPGTLSGGVVVANGDYSTARNADGTCTVVPGSYHDGGANFTGTWSGSAGSFTLLDQDFPTSGSFSATTTPISTATATPVFPMTVTADIGPSVSSASANIQYRADDVGRTGSVYVFAVAPSTVVKAAADGAPARVVGKALPQGPAKADAVACVLAQLDSSGQLQTVSAASIQAYVTGVLSSQGQAVTILNGVPTASIGGATFYVGYGSSPQSMLDNGINRSAVTIPASTVCKPQPPQTGWWWNPNEGGRGYSIETQGNNLFMASYLYDASGAAIWYVAAGPTSLDGSLFSGQLLSFGGGITLTGPYHANTRLPDAGAITLAFSDASHGTLVWPGGPVALQRYPFGADGADTQPLGNQPENGWWWGGANDSGRGFFIEWQGARAFLAGYMYDAQGKAIWYVADAPVTSSQSFAGTWLQFGGGQTLTGAYHAPSPVNGNVAPVTIQFQGADTALITLPSGTLPLTRFRF